MSESFPKSESSEKHEKIKRIFSYIENGEIIQFVPDAIVALSGSLVATKGDRQGFLGYKSPSYADIDNKGLTSGGKARVIAVSEAHEHFREAKIVTNSRDVDIESTRPSHASVYASELLSMGVLQEALVAEEDTHSTLTGIVQLIRLAQEEYPEWEHIAIVSNEYHIPRILAMMQLLPKLLEEDDPMQKHIADFFAAGKKMVPIAAESILEVRDSRYASLFERVKETEAYKDRVAMEMKGIKDLEDGTYNKNLPSTH